MYKCKMYWSMAHYQPYAIYKNDIISGFENDLMMGLADYLNFTLVNYPSLQKFNIKVGFDIANEMVKWLLRLSLLLFNAKLSFIFLAGREWIK